MINLTKGQQKIIYLLLILIVALILFLFLIFIPQKRRLSEIKSELRNTESQISDITQLTQGQDLSETVKKIDQQLANAISALPKNDELVIKYLSKNARKLEIDIKNMSLAGKINIDHKIAGYVIEELPITLSLSCNYKALSEYLKLLRQDSAILVKIKQVNIASKGQGRPALQVNLGLSAFLAEESPGAGK